MSRNENQPRDEHIHFENEPPIGRFLLNKFDALQGEIPKSGGTDYTWSDLAQSPVTLAKGAAVLAAYLTIGIPELALANIKMLAKHLYGLATQREPTTEQRSWDDQTPNHSNDRL